MMVIKQLKHWEYSAYHKRLWCPYCGSEMEFLHPVYYEYSTGDWYWFCLICGMSLPNRSTLPEEYLTKARDLYRTKLTHELDTIYKKYMDTKRRFESYGVNNPSMRNPPLGKKNEKDQ